MHPPRLALKTRGGRLAIAGLCCLLTQSGCTSASRTPAPNTASTPEAVVQGAVYRVEPVSWPSIARVQGSLFPDEVTTLSARVQGRIRSINCELGDTVSKDQVLLILDDSEYALRVIQAEAQLSQARAAVGLRPGDSVESLDPLNAPPVREARAVLDEAKQQIVRLQGLFAQGTIVATDLETAELDERVADARFNSAVNSVREKMAVIGVQVAQLQLAEQQLADTRLLAPLDGQVQRRMVSVGTYIQAGEPLMEIARTNLLRYRAAVPERFAQQLAVGQGVVIRVNQDEYRASVARITPTLDASNRSLVFETEIPNPENRLRAGLFAQAELLLDEQAVALAIPSSALVRFAGVDKVWKINQGKVSESVVEIGRQRDQQIEILSGLSSGEMILVDGQLGQVGRFQAETDALADRPSALTAPGM